jgi:hypothetical protein
MVATIQPPNLIITFSMRSIQMFKLKLFRHSILFVIILLSFITMAQAQSPQTFVSVRGNDNNPCTVAQPCRTFTRALNEVKPRGEVIAVDSGDYAGFTVNKSATISAAPGVHAGLAGVIIGVNIAASDTVVLRRLRLNGLGTTAIGIHFYTAGKLLIEDCQIEDYDDFAINCSGPTGASQQVFIKDTIVRRATYGIILGGTTSALGISKAVIQHCRLEEHSTSGISVGAGYQATITDTVSAFNNRGFDTIGNGELNLENCVSSHNTEGVTAIGTSIIRVANSTITGNTTGLYIEGTPSLLTRRNNTVEGNPTNGTFTGAFGAK